MTEKELIDLLNKYGQKPILNHYNCLEENDKRRLRAELQGLDLNLVFNLFKKFSSKEDPSRKRALIQEAPIISLPKTPQEKLKREEARALGESLIGRGKVAVLIVAGGQGTRLGFEGPKGKFPISPLKKKSLFQLFAESVKALSVRYQANTPLLIMTNQENQQETREFFESRNFFALDKNNVYFFNQGMLPTLSPEGQLVLRDDVHLLVNPDGHGGSLKAFYESGLWQKLSDRGFAEVFYCQVDNPLVKIADPVFIGYHRMEKAEISTKVVRRRDLKEKVGIYGLVNGHPAIVEYSDFRPEDYEALDEKGNIKYWAGNTAIHMISFSFIEHLNRHGFALPYHRALKEVEGKRSEGRGIKMTGWKFETFVFDSLPLAQKSCCMEVLREEEFSPVKNQQGNDSPATAREAMVQLHRSWLKEAGARLKADAQVEISPLFALDKKELMEKLKGQKLIIKEDRYFG